MQDFDLIDLIIFDADGTLCERDSGALLAGVEERLAILDHPGCRNRPQIAIVSNQGGVGCRHWMESAGFGEPEQFPTQADVEAKFQRLLANLDFSIIEPRLYVCFAYQSKQSGEWAPTPAGAEDDSRWRRDWRKPAPGMLLAAMRDAGVTPDRTLVIGNQPEDRDAARAAGCVFQWAQKWFSRGWAEGENYGLVR